MINFSSGKFSGPLALLLSLIEKEEMDITQISLAKIADDFVVYLEKGEGIFPEQISDFLLIAAKLLYIKSRALLPYLATPEGDQEAEELEKQLRMYKEFLLAMETLEKILAGKHFAFLKENKGITRQFLTPKFSPPKNISSGDLASVYGDILQRTSSAVQELKEEILFRQINIEERIAVIKEKIISGESFSFRELVKNSADRTEVVVNFLALLELAKQRELFFSQSELFGEIKISKII